MDELFRRIEQVAERVQMLRGIFSAKGILPLEFEPAYSVGDLLTEHLDEWEQEAEHKGGIQQVPSDHFSRIFKVNWSLGRAA
jgi:hypothetical protein